MSEPGTAPWRRAEASRLIAFGRAAALPDGGFGWLGVNGEIDVTQPCPLYVNARMTYVFATLDAAQTTPPAWLLEAATALFDTAVADAWQRDDHPGLIYTVDSDGQPVVTARMHWVACEAVLAADALHRRTRGGTLRRGGGAVVG